MPRPIAAVVELLLIVAIALGLAEGVQAAVLKPFRIPSASMEPTLTIGQRVLVNRVVYRLHPPRRGDIIVFHPPTSLECGVPVVPVEPCPQGNGKEDSTYFIKRVVALPGETLSVRDGHPWSTAASSPTSRTSFRATALRAATCPGRSSFPGVTSS